MKFFKDLLKMFGVRAICKPHVVRPNFVHFDSTMSESRQNVIKHHNASVQNFANSYNKREMSYADYISHVKAYESLLNSILEIIK